MKKCDAITIKYLHKDIKVSKTPAGSGKTRVMTARLLNDLKPIGEIVAKRSASKIGVRVQKVTRFYD